MATKATRRRKSGDATRRIKRKATRHSEEKRGGVSRPRLLSMIQLLKESREQDYIVDEICPSNSTIGFIGSAEALKSTTAVGVAGSVAFGVPWHGRRVKHGAVAIIAGEGHSGLGTRFRAWAKVHNVKLKGAPIIVTKGGMQLSDRASTSAFVRRLARRMAKLRLTPRLIIVDPVARTFAPGDENNTGDMCRYIENVEEMRRHFGCSVILVHHSGHGDKTRARGSSALKAALDLEVVFVRKGPGVQVSCTKSKDAPHFANMQFAVKEVQLKSRESGRPKTGIVLELADTPLAGGNAPVKQQAALALLKELMAKRGRARQGDSSGGRRWVRMKTWRTVAVKHRHIVDTEEGFNKLKRKLVEKKQLLVRDGLATVR
jgi:hypothetical protein